MLRLKLLPKSLCKPIRPACPVLLVLQKTKSDPRWTQHAQASSHGHTTLILFLLKVLVCLHCQLLVLWLILLQVHFLQGKPSTPACIFEQPTIWV